MHEPQETPGGSNNDNPWADRVNEAYYDKMGVDFGRKTRDRINWMCAQAKGESVLDVGCSQGVASILMAREGMRVVGVDIDSPTIDYAWAERAKEIETVAARLDFRCSDLAALEGERFDTVVMGEVIEHQTNPGRFVETAAGFVADGGRLVITVPFGLHPWPDHKSTIFPRHLYAAVADSFGLSHLDVSAGYIRMVLDRHSGGCPADDAAAPLFIATEKGAIEVQERFYEANAKVQALDKAKGELNVRLRQLEQAQGELTEQRNKLDREVALKSQQVSDLQLRVESAMEANATRGKVADAAVAANEARLHRTEELLQEVALQKVLSVQSSRTICELEEAKQSLARQLEDLRREAATGQDAAESRLSGLQRELEDLRGQQDHLRESSAALQDEGNQARVGREDAEAKLSELQEKAESRLAGLQRELEDLRGQHDRLRESSATLQDEGNQARVGREDAEAKLSELQHELGELGRKHGLMQELCDSLQGERDGATRRANAANEKFVRQQQVCAALERELGAAREAAAQHQASENSLGEKLRLVGAELAVAQHKRTGHYLHLEAERQRTRALLPLLQNMHRENQLYQHSVALELGRTILGLRSLRGIVAFPSRLHRVWRDYRRRSGGEIAMEPLVLPRFQPAILPPFAKSRGQPSQPGDGVQRSTDVAYRPQTTTEDAKCRLSGLGWEQEIRPSSIAVASVLDEFSRACFAPQASLIEPRPDNWEALLETYAPKFLLVESSWKGNYGTWQYRVANYAHPPGRELSEMIEGFRLRGIPTVFWNKEDPVHFDNFIEAASQFDFVLTTAAEAVPRYQERTQASIGVLQFAAEEGLHNPIGSAARNGKVCFAGSFYANRFHERRDDQLMLLDAATEFDLDIFDRNHDPKATVRSDFEFPERFSPFVRGRMPYAAMGRAYREYKVFLNVNSVVDSPTMFSRRVFELLACGTPVVSTWSRGTEETFGDDLIWHVRSREEAVEAIRVLLTDDHEWRRRSLAGIRAVLSRHTFRHRFREILDMVGLESVTGDTFSRIQVVAEVASKEEADSVLASFERQQVEKGTNKQLLLLTKNGVTPSINTAGVEVYQDTGVADALTASRKATKANRLISIFSPQAVYGPHHLQDLMLASRYSKAVVVGKPKDGCRSSEYRYNVTLDPRTLLVDEGRLATLGGRLESALFDSGAIMGSVPKENMVFAVDSTGFVGGEEVIDCEHHSAVLAGMEA